MNKSKKRIPLPVKIILGVLIIAILIAGGFMAKLLYEQSKMSPLPTEETIPGIYAINNDLVNLFLIKGDDGYLAIDAGYSEKQTAAALDLLGIPASEVRAVLLTHSHGDHIAALSLFTEAQVYLSEYENGGSQLTAVSQTLRDGETINLAGLSVGCILTPGHSAGSMCFLIEGKYLFVGDNMSLKDGKAELFNSFYNMDDEIQRGSLQKLASSVMPEYIFTAHYGYTDDPAAAFTEWVR